MRREDGNILDKWRETAGAWSDEPIGKWSWAETTRFAARQTWREKALVDGAKIIATDHASYNRDMTWRQFLRHGQRISQFDKGIASFDDTDDPWTLVESEGSYYIREGNHRSVISKFQAIEEGVSQVRVHRAITLHQDRDAQALHREIESLLRPRQRVEVEPVRNNADEDERTFAIQFRLRGFRGGPKSLDPREALDFILEHNESLRKKALRKINPWQNR